MNRRLRKSTRVVGTPEFTEAFPLRGAVATPSTGNR